MKRTTISLLLILFSITMVYSQQDTLIFKYRSLALDYQQSVKIAEKSLEGANSLVEASKSSYMPRVDIDGNYKFFGNPVQLGVTEDSPAGQELSNMYEMGLWVNQPVFTGGYLKNTKNVAMAQSDVARSYVGISEQNTMLEADASYLAVVAKKESSLLALQYLEIILQFQQVIQDRVDEEVVGMNELYQAKVRSNDAQYEVIRIDKEFRVSLMGLNRLIGVPLETESEHMDSLLVVDWEKPDGSNVEKALQQRPEVSMKENEMSANQYSEKVTASYYNPQLNIGAGATYGAPSPGLLSEPGANYHVTARLVIPVFYWGQKNEKVFASQKITEQTQLELERTMDIVALQVTSGYYELQRSQEQVNFASGALNNAEKNVEVMVDRYFEGLASVLEVLDAQLYWQKSYLNYIGAKYELNMAYSTYLKAMGELSAMQ